MKMCSDYIHMIQLPDHSYQTSMGFQPPAQRGNEPVFYGKEHGLLGIPPQAMLYLPSSEKCTP